MFLDKSLRKHKFLDNTLIKDGASWDVKFVATSALAAAAAEPRPLPRNSAGRTRELLPDRGVLLPALVARVRLCVGLAFSASAHLPSGNARCVLVSQLDEAAPEVPP